MVNNNVTFLGGIPRGVAQLFPGCPETPLAVQKVGGAHTVQSLQLHLLNSQNAYTRGYNTNRYTVL